MSDGSKVFTGSVLILLMVLFLTCFGPAACTDSDGTKKILQQSGYTNIEITGFRFWMKGEEDWTSTGFVATSPNGERVTGAVTGGLFKGKTIRFD